MSETEVIFRQESGVTAHNSESPPTVGLRAGAFAEVGTLILTNKRLIYIAKGGSARAAAWALGGVFAAQAVEKQVSKAEIDELMTCEGSYFVPLQNITRVEAGKKMGQGFIRVDNTSLPQPVHAYVFGGGSNNKDWEGAINYAKATINSAPTTQPIFSAPQQSPRLTSSSVICRRCGTPDNYGAKFCASCGSPLGGNQSQNFSSPPAPISTPTCPYCRSPIRYIEQYQRWYCDQEKRYV
jgi:hypothetical protein